MNRTLLFWSIALCFCLVLGLALGTAANEVFDQEQTQAALADTLPMPAVPHRIRNKVLREHIEQFEQRHGQDPDHAQRGISVFCQSYHSGRQLDSLRYDITYTVINFLPTFPFILCDSIQDNMNRYAYTFLHLYANDAAFKQAFQQSRACASRMRRCCCAWLPASSMPASRRILPPIWKN